MIVDQIGVCRVGLESLVGVAHATWNENRLGRIQLGCEHGSEGRAFAEIDPGAEDTTGRYRHPLIPWLRVDAARRADGIVEGNVVLHGAEIWKPQRDHLLALPILFEPAPCITVHREVEDNKTWDRGRLGLEGLAVLGHARHCPLLA